MSIPMLNVDEAFFAAASVRALEEHELPLIATRDNKPPGIFLFYMVAFDLFGEYNMVAVRAMGLIWVVATALVVGACARRLGGTGAGFVAAGCYLLATSVDARLIAVKTELLAALPIAIGLWGLIVGLQGRSHLPLLVAGLAFGCATMFKQPAALIPLAVGAYLLFEALRLRDIDCRHLVVAALEITGTLCAVVASVLTIYVLHGALTDFVHQVFIQPLTYAAIDRVSNLRRVVRFLAYAEMYNREFPVLAYMFVAWVVSFIVGVLKDQLPRGRYQVHFALIAASVGAVAAVNLGADLYRPYFLFVIPIACICTGDLVARMLFAARTEAPVLRTTLIAVVLTGVFCTSIAALKDPLRTALAERQEARSGPIIERVRQLASARDRMYVWGYAPWFYLESRLTPATRYTQTDFVVGFFGEGDRKVSASDRAALAERGAFDRFVEELQQEAPRFFVDASMSDMFGMGSFSIENYRPLARMVDESYCRDVIESLNRNKFVLLVRRSPNGDCPGEPKT